jgi:hypothetical protein
MMLDAARSAALSGLVLLSLVGNAAAQCDSLAARKGAITVAGYDYTGLVETSLAHATFDVTGIKCADGYRKSDGTVTATVASCGAGDSGAYAVSGCVECTSGTGLCTDPAEAPNAVYGDQVYFQDTGMTVRSVALTASTAPLPPQPPWRNLALQPL